MVVLVLNQDDPPLTSTGNGGVTDVTRWRVSERSANTFIFFGGDDDCALQSVFFANQERGLRRSDIWDPDVVVNLVEARSVKSVTRSVPDMLQSRVTTGDF